MNRDLATVLYAGIAGTVVWYLWLRPEAGAPAAKVEPQRDEIPPQDYGTPPAGEMPQGYGSA